MWKSLLLHVLNSMNVNTWGPRQNGRYFPEDIFKLIFLNENVLILIKISLKFVPIGPINNIPALVQVMAWRRPGGKPLSEPMMVSLLTHICVTRPQWVKLVSEEKDAQKKMPRNSCDIVYILKSIWRCIHIVFGNSVMYENKSTQISTYKTIFVEN